MQVMDSWQAPRANAAMENPIGDYVRRRSPSPHELPDAIVVPNVQAVGNGAPPPPEDKFRAVHRIRLSALRHNFACVESAASRQRCSVILVVKADGYGHGAIPTALHLADTCGADAFAVATLEEAIALRRAFVNNPPGRWSPQLASAFDGGGVPGTVKSTANGTVTLQGAAKASSNLSRSNSGSSTPVRSLRSPHIRILVLGAPVGFPRCFDDYFHHGIEVMVSGPEVAAALLNWVADEKERKRTQVERAAAESKEKALLQPLEENRGTCATTPDSGLRGSLRHPSSTLGNVSGQDLVKEVRALLIKQQAATEASNLHQAEVASSAGSASEESGSADSVVPADTGTSKGSTAQTCRTEATTKTGSAFSGIEAAAKVSRARQVASTTPMNGVFQEDSASESPPSGNASGEANQPVRAGPMKRLRWHLLVDSGMGRLGFQTAEPNETGARDTVDILKEMLHAENNANGPIEFFGMCTHMADATNSLSDYTNTQIERFIGLLKRVRAAGISIPTVSTDNSAALLNTSLTHFDATAILSQPDADTRGYVRTGGGVFGQRPFPQLRAVSTLLVSVRHVAVLKKGESVGYDRAYIAPDDVRIATLAIGFADGYPRELGNGVGRVCIRGAVFPVAGNVCMDMLMVELGLASDKTGVGATVMVGDTAVLWGPLNEDSDEGQVTLSEVAKTLKTTLSALTCGLNTTRVLRQYV